MSKAATQRKRARIKHLVNLATLDPVAFEQEWQKRLTSWMESAECDAGRLRNFDEHRLPSVFSRVDEALNILRECGEKIFEQYAEKTYDLLTTECCRQVSYHFDRRLFKTGAKLEPH